MSSKSPTELSEILGCSYSPSPSDSKKDEALSEFTFETDHEALRNNPDYLALLKTFAILQAQKVQAVQDIDRLLEAKEEALKNPLQLVEKLQRGEDLGLPAKQDIADIPDIDWEKYNIAGSQVKKPETRQKGYNSSDYAKDALPRVAVEGLGCKVEKTAKGQFFVRGRIFDDQKPKTFNQPWTPEEQRRLEELLVQFPSEDVEMERWKKIAAALGNRTAIQVQSRTQKYFLKLQKLGLPIPGRPSRGAKNKSLGKNSSLTKKQGLVMPNSRSSFFPDLSPAVKMTEADAADDDYDRPSQGNELKPEGRRILNDLYFFEMEDVSDEEGVSENIKNSPAYEELMWLKRIRREKEFEAQMDEPLVHAGFRCDGCNVEPIIGGRFQCTNEVCKGSDTVDFCCECAPKGLQMGKHDKDHILRPVRKKRLFVC